MSHVIILCQKLWGLYDVKYNNKTEDTKGEWKKETAEEEKKKEHQESKRKKNQEEMNLQRMMNDTPSSFHNIQLGIFFRGFRDYFFTSII